MRTATHAYIHAIDFEDSCRLYDDAVADVTVSPSFWRGIAIAAGFLFLGGAAAYALIASVVS